MTTTNKNEGWASLKIIVFISLAIYFPSCYPAKIPLSPEEEKLCTTLAREYQCEVHMQHDYFTVSDSGKGGTFYVWLESSDESLCSKDSSYFRATSSKITNDVTGIMSHKKNYRFVSVVFHVEKITGKDSHETLCSRTADVRIDSTGIATIRGWWTPKDDKWAPSDHIIER